MGVRRQLFKYAWPSIIGMLIVGIQTFVDGIFVSKGVGALGLAAINLSMPLISVMTSIGIMIISGGVVIAGVAKGEGDMTRSRGYTKLTFAVLLSACLLMSAFCALNLRRICYFLGADDQVYPFVRQYLGIIGCGIIFYVIPNYTEAFTRFMGRPNWVFLSGTICFAVNVVLDYFFVLKWNWGVAGAASATCIANTSAAIVLAHNVQTGKMVGKWKDIWRMVYNGSSEMLTSVSAAITTYIFNQVLMQQVGPKGVAALTIVFYLNFIVNMSIFGLSQAVYPLMSYQKGAKDAIRIRQLLQTALLFGGCIGIGVFLVVLFFKKGIVGLFTEGDVELNTLAITAATYVTIHYLFSFVNIIATSFHTAIERPLESVVIALCRSIIFVLIPLFTLTPLIGQLGIWLSMPIAEALTLTVSIPLMVKSMQSITYRNLEVPSRHRSP